MRNKRGLGQRVNTKKRERFTGDLVIMDPENDDICLTGAEQEPVTITIS